MGQEAHAQERCCKAGQELLPLYPAEIRLLELMRAMGHGKLEEVIIANGLPVQVERLRDKIRLV